MVDGPEQLLQQLMVNNFNPMLMNLVQMARKGNTKDVETFARNFFNGRGRDFDKEFAEFMNQIK